MKYKNNTKIESITHEDLSDLLSTALYGSSYLSAEYDHDFYNSIPENERHGDCYEDHMADVLLKGGTVIFYDSYAEGVTYGDNPNKSVTEDEEGCYPVTLQDIISGLEKCANGTYNVNDDKSYLNECFNNFATGYDYDLSAADSIMQVILFNELIYG